MFLHLFPLKLPMVEWSIKIFILLFFVLFQLLRPATFLNVTSFDVITVKLLWKYFTSINVYGYMTKNPAQKIKSYKTWICRFYFCKMLVDMMMHRVKA